MNKKHIYILLAVVILLIAGVGWWSTSNKGLEPENPVVISSEVDTSNWLTYRNEEVGFEFKYPKTLNILDNFDGKYNTKFTGDGNRGLFMSYEEIEYNDFINGFDAPISIELFDGDIDESKGSRIKINNTSGTYIESIIPERKPTYPSVETITVFFDSPKVSLKTSGVVDAKKEKLDKLISDILLEFRVLTN